MKKLNKQEIISRTIERLSDPQTYNSICHEHRLGDPLPSLSNLKRIIEITREILFPGYFGNTNLEPVLIRHYMGVYIDELYQLMNNEILAGLCFECNEKIADRKSRHAEQARNLSVEFIDNLPAIRKILTTDVEATYLGDPAARILGEVIFCYPGLRAITNYRIAHFLLQTGVPLIPRIISEMAHSETGIDIHPMAVIGDSFMIDHGTGVVIGSTSIIGRNVKIYQGVTLGARSFPLDGNGNPMKGIARHPIVEDDVIIYAGATILGRVTIGKGSVIGGNAWITQDLPPYSKVSLGSIL